MSAKHKAIEGAKIQHAALFKRMAMGGDWDLYEWPGSFGGVAIFERRESPEYPPIISDVHCMTADTMATNINQVWEDAERIMGSNENE